MRIPSFQLSKETHIETGSLKRKKSIRWRLMSAEQRVEAARASFRVRPLLEGERPQTAAEVSRMILGDKPLRFNPKISDYELVKVSFPIAVKSDFLERLKGHLETLGFESQAESQGKISLTVKRGRKYYEIYAAAPASIHSARFNSVIVSKLKEKPALENRYFRRSIPLGSIERWQVKRQMKKLVSHE